MVLGERHGNRALSGLCIHPRAQKRDDLALNAQVFFRLFRRIDEEFIVAHGRDEHFRPRHIDLGKVFIGIEVRHRLLIEQVAIVMEQARDVGSPELGNGGVVGNNHHGRVFRRTFQECAEEAVGHFVGFAIGTPAFRGVFFTESRTRGIDERQEDVVDVVEDVDVGVEQRVVLFLKKVLTHAGDPLTLVLNLFEAGVQVGDTPDVRKYRGVFQIRPKAVDQLAAQFRRLAEVVYMHDLGTVEQETTCVRGDFDGFAAKGRWLFRALDREGAIDPVAPGAGTGASEFCLAVAVFTDSDGVVTRALRVEKQAPEGLILTVALRDDLDGEF